MRQVTEHGIHLHELPAWLAVAVERVARDLREPTTIGLRFGWTPPRPDDPERMCTIRARTADGEGLGGWTLPASLADDAPRLVCVLAEWLQNELCESDAAWAEARPPCPGHAHPARPDQLGDDAWWVCPGSGEPIARIGELAS